MTDHQKALDKAKIELMRKPDVAFFTTICFSMKHVWDEKIPTAATNGKKIYFSPKFFMSLDADERVFLLVHESMHPAYLHIDRARIGSRNFGRWNRAADYVINLQLVKRGFKMPKVGLLDHRFDGMSVEQVYDILDQEEKNNSYPKSAPWEDLMEPESEELQKDIEEILVRASIQSKMAGDKPGSIPGDIQIFLDRLLNPKLPWNRILQKHLKGHNKNDYSWKRPNRRFFPKHHLPSLYSEGLIDLAVFVDISASVTDEEFNYFVSETASILKMMKPEKISLGQFDTEIKSVDEVRNLNDLMKITFTGRGGTLINPVLEWANENKPKCLVVFSDGGFNFYELATKTDTLWLIHNNERFTAPFGKVIHYEMN